MGYYGEEIRKLMAQVLGLRKKTEAHDEDIEAVKARLAELEDGQAKSIKVAEQQGLEVEETRKQIDKLKRILSKVEKKNVVLKSEAHGAKIKAGLARAKLEKMKSGRRHH